MKNLYRKLRPFNRAYFVVHDKESGWSWHVLKLNQDLETTINNPLATVFLFVMSPVVPDGEYGDGYVDDVPGLRDQMIAQLKQDNDTLSHSESLVWQANRLVQQLID